jgi:membrane protein implicated in regulation of membrane protease activity
MAFGEHGIAMRAPTCHDRDVAIIWLVAGIALAIAEMFTMTFVLIMFAAGALAASAVAAFDAGLTWQILTFAVVSALALAVVRPIVGRQLERQGSETPIGLRALEGETALVLETVDGEHGLVKIGGEVWRARPYDASQAIEVGERVLVIEVKGATAMVWRDSDGTC